ncbi:MAG: hypothetical protein JSU03_05065 [Bacteroidetes bacterium]|nr:hypothetical protein [Bacteroidota bacterium]
MTLTIIFWIVGVHLLELLGIAMYLLIRKNKVLEKTLINQQQWIDAIAIRINDGNDKLNELDRLGAFKADDETGFFFRNLIEIQNELNQFVNTQK